MRVRWARLPEQTVSLVVVIVPATGVLFTTNAEPVVALSVWVLQAPLPVTITL